MAKAVDLLSVVLLLAAAGAFALGLRALGEQRDLGALYWLVVGGLVLRAATEMIRPRSGAR
jgi:hypothetical protein